MLSCLLGASCAEAPAVRSCWNIQPRANVVHTAVEAIHGPTDLAVPPPLCAARSCSQGDMSARTIDVKLQFDRFNGIAGPAARIFRRNLIQCGGERADLASSMATIMSSTPVRYPTPNASTGSPQPTSVEVTDPLLCPPELGCVCLECPTLVSGSGVLALRCRTSRSPCRVELNTRSTTLVTHDAGGRYNILFYSASVRCKSNSTARSINPTRRPG